MSLQQLSRVTLRCSPRVTVLVALFGTSLVYALWRWLVQVEGVRSSGRKRKLPPGLFNTGNTCFMNALLQSFSSTASFVTWIKHFSSSVTDDTERQYLANTILQTTRVLNGEVDSQSNHDASDLLQEMAGRGWQISSEEQDSHEFFHAVITTLREELYHFRCGCNEIMDLSVCKDLLNLPLKQPGKCMQVFEHSMSHVDCPFRGSLASILQCATCGHHNPTKCEGFDSLSIPLGQSMTYKMTLMECLEKFMSPEVLNGVDCESCSSSREAEVTSCAGSIDSSISKFGQATRSWNTVDQTEEQLCNEQNSSLGKNHENRNSRSTFQYQRSFLHNVTNCNMRGTVKHAESKKYLHPHTSIKRSFHRSLCLAKLPECLCIHLQRLVWIGGNPMKVMKFVLFPEILDVTSLTYSNRLVQNRSNEKLRQANSGIGNASNRLLVNREYLRTSTSSIQTHHNAKNLYRLTSVIVHVGDWSCNGHFYAYRKGITKGQPEWVFTSDTLVRKATREEVFSCPAYMLIYEKVQKLGCLGQG